MDFKKPQIQQPHPKAVDSLLAHLIESLQMLHKN